MKIQVKDRTLGTVLKEFAMSEQAAAYAYAAEMEEIGIEVDIASPTVTQTLGETLGVSEADSQKMEESIRHEIEEHDVVDSCCFKETDKSKLH